MEGYGDDQSFHYGTLEHQNQHPILTRGESVPPGNRVLPPYPKDGVHLNSNQGHPGNQPSNLGHPGHQNQHVGHPGQHTNLGHPGNQTQGQGHPPVLRQRSYGGEDHSVYQQPFVGRPESRCSSGEINHYRQVHQHYYNKNNVETGSSHYGMIGLSPIAQQVKRDSYQKY